MNVKKILIALSFFSFTQDIEQNLNIKICHHYIIFLKNLQYRV